MRVSVIKLIAGAAFTVASFAGVAGTAAASQPVAQYPVVTCFVTTSTATFLPGSTITITGTAGTPNGTTTFVITLPDGTILELVGQNDIDGVSSVSFITPNQTGTYSIVAVCPNGDSSPPTTTVGVPTTTTTISRPGLPRTGSDPMNSLRVAGVMALLGGGMFLVARRRRQEPTAN